MKKNRFFIILITALLIMAVYSCEKPIDTFPNSNEVISFKNIDTTTITRRAGEELNIDVVLITDKIIDSLSIAYFIDTIGLTKNLKYSDTKTVAVSTGFTEDNNKHEYPAVIKLPANAYGIRAFRPFVNGKGDFVRIIFKMNAGDKTYEKQLKVIIEP